MRIVGTHSHLNGLEWLMVHRSELWQEVQDVIATIQGTDHETKISKEKRRKGKALLSPSSLNAAFKDAFVARNWRSEHLTYWVTDDFDLIYGTRDLSPKQQRDAFVADGKKALRTYSQTDFVKDEVAVEVQFGKYSFIAYDIFVKHGFFYGFNQISVGVEIVPMKSMQRRMSSGPGYYEKAIADLARQGRAVPPVPLVVLGIDA